MRICTQHQGANSCPGVPCWHPMHQFVRPDAMLGSCALTVPPRSSGSHLGDFRSVCLLGFALGVPLWQGASRGSPLGYPLTGTLYASSVAHPVPLIALSEGTHVAPTFVRRYYDKTNTRFSWDCLFRMNNFPSHRNILYCIQQQYIKEKRDLQKTMRDLCWKGKKGGVGYKIEQGKKCR